jgi:PilZ domain-containing protein
MLETRISPRYRASKAATIEFAGGAIDCMVRDLSITGAALTVSNEICIPKKFKLVMHVDGLCLPCHVVWRRGSRMGVAFD